MSKAPWVVVALVGALAQGCMANQTDVAKASVLLHPVFPYGVAYDDEARRSVLGDDWQLKNYRVYKNDTKGETAIERRTP